MTRRFYIFLLAVGLPIYAVGAGWAGSGAGSEAASFLDIPIGAAPAALGSAYTARAEDAYAPVWNPAGLAYTDATRLSATHLAYLAGFHYEYAGLAVPLKNHQGLGASIQYLGADDFVAASEQGNITGTFSTTFAAYSLAYGRMFGSKWSLGLTGKLISEKISDASADGFAGDIGLLYKPNDKVTVGAAAANLGPEIKFVNEGDPLPSMLRAGVLAQVFPDVDASGELTYHRTGLIGFRSGIQGKYANVLILRVGLNTEHTHGLSPVSMITAGVGIHLFGQDFAYAWVPYGELGNAHTISLDLRFGGKDREAPKSGLLNVDAMPKDKEDSLPETAPKSGEYDLLNQLLTDSEKKSLERK